MRRNSFPPSIANLLLEEGQRYKSIEGETLEALGTGIISVVGTARSGKTSLSYTMLDFVIKYTKRPVILDSFPQRVIDEGIPEHWRGRVSNEKFENIAGIDEPAVWLVDDTAANFNSRDAMASKSKMLARVAGVLSHFAGGMTVIFTTQMLSGVDISFFRYTNLATVIRYVDHELIAHERPEWRDLVIEGQYQLQQVSSRPHRQYYYSSKDKIVAEALFPSWLDKKVDPLKADLLSRPMRYHTIEDKEMIIGKRKIRNKKTMEEKLNDE